MPCHDALRELADFTGGSYGAVAAETSLRQLDHFVEQTAGSGMRRARGDRRRGVWLDRLRGGIAGTQSQFLRSVLKGRRILEAAPHFAKFAKDLEALENAVGMKIFELRKPQL